MKRKTSILFDRIYQRISQILFGCICGWVVLAGIGLIPAILNHFGVWENRCYRQYYAGMQPVLVILGVAVLSLVLMIVCVLPFTTANVDDRASEKVRSPLRKLSKKHKKAIIRLLQEKGKPEQEGERKMKRSEVCYILNALMELGYIDEREDTEQLRLWVIQATGYQEGDKAHFAEAMDRCKRNNKTQLAKNLIEQQIAKA